MPETIIFSLLNGLVYGLLLFMLSSGLTLIFSMMGVLNIAHASFYMLGAYFAFQVSTFSSFWAALVAAPLIVAALGMIVERYGLRHVHSRGHVAELLLTFGLAYLIEEIVKLVWGRMAVPYSVPESLDYALFTLQGIDYPAYRVFMVGVSVAMFIFLYLLLIRTRVGLIIRASLTHPQMVAMLGHNVPRVFMFVFGAGCGLAGLAGVIGGNYLVTDPGMATNLGTIVFVVIVLGGMGSLTGALYASLLVGFLQTFAVAVDVSLLDLLRPFSADPAPGTPLWDVARITVAQVAPILPYLLLVLTLLVRPQGLFGGTRL